MTVLNTLTSFDDVMIIFLERFRQFASQQDERIKTIYVMQFLKVLHYIIYR